jgi:hypothetical protein
MMKIMAQRALDFVVAGQPLVVADGALLVIHAQVC